MRLTMWANSLRFVILLYAISSILASPCGSHDNHCNNELHSDIKRSSETYLNSNDQDQDVNATLSDLPEIMAVCNESFRIGFDYLKEFNNSGSLPDETDKTPMCFMRCVLEKAGILSSDGVVNRTKIFDILWPNAEDSIDTCQGEGVAEKHPCQRAYIIARCIMTQVLANTKDTK